MHQPPRRAGTVNSSFPMYRGLCDSPGVTKLHSLTGLDYGWLQPSIRPGEFLMKFRIDWVHTQREAPGLTPVWAFLHWLRNSTGHLLCLQSGGVVGLGLHQEVRPFTAEADAVLGQEGQEGPLPGKDVGALAVGRRGLRRWVRLRRLCQLTVPPSV